MEAVGIEARIHTAQVIVRLVHGAVVEADLVLTFGRVFKAQHGGQVKGHYRTVPGKALEAEEGPRSGLDEGTESFFPEEVPSEIPVESHPGASVITFPPLLVVQLDRHGKPGRDPFLNPKIFEEQGSSGSIAHVSDPPLVIVQILVFEYQFGEGIGNGSGPHHRQEGPG